MKKIKVKSKRSENNIKRYEIYEEIEAVGIDGNSVSIVMLIEETTLERLQYKSENLQNKLDEINNKIREIKKNVSDV